MLLQSQEGFINLLPAVPSKWKDGFIRGLRAIGGYEVDMNWRSAVLTAVKVKATNNGLCRIKAPREISRISSGKDAVRMQKSADGIISFDAKAGKEYQLVFRN
jgi:alpha-L-fucosidase 2